MSFSVSPLVRLEAAAEILMMSALRRMAANSKEVRVRVLGSTKRLISVLPCKRRDFFNLARPDLLERVRRFEDESDFLG